MNPSGTFNYCKLCEVSVSGNLEAHNQGKKHVRFSQIMAQRHTEAERTIFVCGFSTSTNVQNLTTHFNKYGKVTKVHIQKTKAMYAFVEFATAAEAKATLQPSASHIVDRRLLVVKPKAAERPTTYIPDPPINTTPSINHDQLMNQLRAAESVLAQMTLLYELLRLTPKDLEVRKNIVQRLEAVFVMRIPECRVRQFGSSVNGCGMRGSDMDLFLDLNLETDCAASSSHGSTTSPASGASTPSPPNRPNTPNTVLRITDTGRKLIAGLKQATVRQRINYVHKVLAGSNLRLGKLLKIPSTRCPYVQFVHAASGTDCDLSINNRLALQNTELLKTMCRIEPRFQTLIFTLRYLFKVREISGGASGGQRLSSYALCWLAITYMQQCDPPLLPSINRLMELAGPEEQTVTEGWDTSFSRYPDAWRENYKTPTHTNGCPHAEQAKPVLSGPGVAGYTTAANELLTGFFAFYSKLNLSTSVLCPRLGAVLTLTDFLTKAAEDPLQKDFKLNMVNIQDPFVLSHNLAQNLNNRLAEHLTDELSEAAAKTVHAQFSTPRQGHDWGLTFLMSGERLIGRPNQPASGAGPPSSATSFNYCIDVEFQAAAIPSFVFTEKRSVEEVKALWMRTICALLQEVLSEALLFKCDLTTALPDSAEIKKQQEEVVHDSDDSSTTKKRSSSDSCADEPIEKKICTSESNTNGMDGGLASEKVGTGTQDGVSLELENSSGIAVDMENEANSAEEIKAVQTNAVADEDATETLLLALSVQAMQQTWAGRKSIKKRMQAAGEGVANTLLCEKSIAKRIEAEFGGPSKPGTPAIMKFDVRVIKVCSPSGNLSISIQLRPTLALKMFNSFYQFFKIFFVKLKCNSLITFLK